MEGDTWWVDFAQAIKVYFIPFSPRLAFYLWLTLLTRLILHHAPLGDDVRFTFQGPLRQPTVTVYNAPWLCRTRQKRHHLRRHYYCLLVHKYYMSISIRYSADYYVRIATSRKDRQKARKSSASFKEACKAAKKSQPKVA